MSGVSASVRNECLKYKYSYLIIRSCLFQCCKFDGPKRACWKINSGQHKKKILPHVAEVGNIPTEFELSNETARLDTALLEFGDDCDRVDVGELSTVRGVTAPAFL